VTTFDRSAQAATALQLATARRHAHAAYRRRLASLPKPDALATIADTVRRNPPDLAGLKLEMCFRSVYGWGPRQSRRFAAAIGGGDVYVRIRDLTPGQREVIAGTLDDIVAREPGIVVKAGA